MHNAQINVSARSTEPPASKSLHFPYCHRSIQINFKIALESDAIGSAAVSSINTAVSSGTMSATFSTEAANRNEVVTVSTTILETVCSACSVAIALTADDTVAGTTIAVIASLQMAMLMALIAFWVFATRDVCRNGAARKAGGPTRVVPAANDNLMSPKKIIVSKAKLDSDNGVGIPLSDTLPIVQDNSDNLLYHDTHILEAAAVVCG